MVSILVVVDAPSFVSSLRLGEGSGFFAAPSAKDLALADLLASLLATRSDLVAFRDAVNRAPVDLISDGRAVLCAAWISDGALAVVLERVVLTHAANRQAFLRSVVRGVPTCAAVQQVFQTLQFDATFLRTAAIPEPGQAPNSLGAEAFVYAVWRRTEAAEVLRFLRSLGVQFDGSDYKRSLLVYSATAAICSVAVLDELHSFIDSHLWTRVVVQARDRLEQQHC